MIFLINLRLCSFILKVECERKMPDEKIKRESYFALIYK